MIVISGALVLVAAVLLVLGIVSSITLVYAAIGLSIVSAVFLLVGVFQRPAERVAASEPRDADNGDSRRQAPPREAQLRKDPPKEPEGPAEAEHTPDQPDDAAADFPVEAANADLEARSGATDADVLVVSGRPRYHVAGCQYVEGHHDSEPIEINEARELGFTPCGKCRPNETLARSASGAAHAAHADQTAPVRRTFRSRFQPLRMCRQRQPLPMRPPRC